TMVFICCVLFCLLTGLSECQAAVVSKQTHLNELTREDLTDTLVENDAIQQSNQGLDVDAVLTTNSTTTHPSCEPPICAMMKKLADLEERLAATVSTLEEKLEASERKLSALNSMVTERTGQPQVAFSAALPIDGTIGPANVLYPLVYRHVLSNIGGHYSPGTGYFTAPVRGIYYFTFTSFCWEGRTASCGGSLYRNENQIVSWYNVNQNHPSSGSNSAILQLQVGDYVNVRLWHNRVISDNVNKYSTFSGFLLFAV
uniref:C1q domain-containing protein n=1 Tax=Dicentrarchus labrax TaxID=13489 RepID=A0A8C4DUC8_DICLA